MTPFNRLQDRSGTLMILTNPTDVQACPIWGDLDPVHTRILGSMVAQTVGSCVQTVLDHTGLARMSAYAGSWFWLRLEALPSSHSGSTCRRRHI